MTNPDPQHDSPLWHLNRVLVGPDAATAFAARVAPLLGAGDTVLLSGPIGAGKTHLARSIIQTLQSGSGTVEDVPSPTFTLIQTYQAGALEIWHADLYRLDGPSEVAELGLDTAYQTALCLIEWPDRLGREAPADYLCLTSSVPEDPDQRHLTITAHGSRWAQRAEQFAAALDD